MWVTAAQRCDTNGSGPTCEPQPTFMLNEEYSLPRGPRRVWPGQMKLWVRSLFGNEAESFTCIAISGRVCPCWPALRHVMVLYWAFVQQDVPNPLNSLWRRGHCTSAALRRSPEGTPFWQNSALGIFYALHLFSSLNSSSVKPHDTLGGSDTTVTSPLRSQCLEIKGFPMDSSGNGGPETWTRVFNTPPCEARSHGSTAGSTCPGWFSLRCGSPRALGKLVLSSWSRKLPFWFPKSPPGKVTWCQFWVFVETSPVQGRYSGVGADLILQVHLLCLFLLLRSIINFCSIWKIHIVPRWNDTTLCFYAFIIKHYSWKNHQVCLGSSVQFIFPKLYFE